MEDDICCIFTTSFYTCSLHMQRENAHVKCLYDRIQRYIGEHCMCSWLLVIYFYKHCTK